MTLILFTSVRWRYQTLFCFHWFLSFIAFFSQKHLFSQLFWYLKDLVLFSDNYKLYLYPLVHMYVATIWLELFLHKLSLGMRNHNKNEFKRLLYKFYVFLCKITLYVMNCRIKAGRFLDSADVIIGIQLILGRWIIDQSNWRELGLFQKL